MDDITAPHKWSQSDLIVPWWLAAVHIINTAAQRFSNHTDVFPAFSFLMRWKQIRLTAETDLRLVDTVDQRLRRLRLQMRSKAHDGICNLGYLRWIVSYDRKWRHVGHLYLQSLVLTHIFADELLPTFPWTELCFLKSDDKHELTWIEPCLSDPSWNQNRLSTFRQQGA